MSVPLPAYFGKYQLLSHIAEGGMADVYLGRLVGPGGFEKRLVIKVIRPELAERREFCEMFVAEAKITVALSHGNIVPVYELGVVDGQYFLAMELVDGPTVHQLIFGGPAERQPERQPERNEDRGGARGGAVPPQLAAYIVEQVLRGLDYAHRNGVVHRDLSSANVMCSRDGEVKIVDFGIAAQFQAAQPVRMKGGSAGYMAPEQQRGEGPDARSDLYAAGVLLAEVATGRRFAQLPPPGALGDAPYGLPAPLVHAIERATSPDKETRFADAEAMLMPLSRLLRQGDPPTQADLSRLVRRRSPDERRAARGTPARLIAMVVQGAGEGEAGAPGPGAYSKVAGPRTRPMGPNKAAAAGPHNAGAPRTAAEPGRSHRGDPTPLVPLRPPRTTSEIIPVGLPRHRPMTGELVPVPLAEPLDPLDELELRSAFATPLVPAAPVAGAPEGPMEPAAAPPRGPGAAPPLPPPGGTVIFASRPTRTHATWRTYAGAGLLLVALGLSGAALRARLVARPGLLGAAPGEPLAPGAPQAPGEAKEGVLRVQLPNGATLLVDGQPRDGTAPLHVPPGRHRLQAQAPGRRPLDLTVDVVAGETLRERLHMPWAVGSLRLESTPEAAVTLDGEVVGLTPLSLDVPLDRAASLRLQTKGHAPLLREILPSHWVASSPAARLGTQEEAEGRQPEMRLQLQLEPLERGLLTIGATPWAQVFIDGERKGDTPLRRLPLSAGSHTLRLYCPPPSCPAPRELRQTLVIEPGRELRRIADFHKDPIGIEE